jgi:hypothetical protein
MRGRFRESEHVETPPHRAEFEFSVLPWGPLHSPSQTGVNALMARGARSAVSAPKAAAVCMPQRVRGDGRGIDTGKRPWLTPQENWTDALLW